MHSVTCPGFVTVFVKSCTERCSLPKKRALRNLSARNPPFLLATAIIVELEAARVKRTGRSKRRRNIRGRLEDRPELLDTLGRIFDLSDSRLLGLIFSREASLDSKVPVWYTSGLWSHRLEA